MTKIESDKTEVGYSAEKLFAFLSDFNNFQKLMPPQVSTWTSTADECAFNISGMANIGMKIVDKKPHTEINIVSNGKVPFKFSLNIFIVPINENQCTGQLIFEADLNPMLKMMVAKPMGNFFNFLATKMKDLVL